MGGYIDREEPLEPPSSTDSDPVPKATRVRDFDRTFILFGKVNSGKSTLGNLLMGVRDRAHFETHPFLQPSGLTKVVKSGETKIDASIVYGDDSQSSDLLKIQILDQPGSNDCDFDSENYGEFLMKCIAEAKSEMSATFLILIDLTSSYFSMKEILTFLNIAQILSNSCYSFFPNATIVFTHEDLLVENSEMDAEHILRHKLTQEAYASIQELINLVDQRYIFINGVNYSEINRNKILKQLFHVTRPKLNVYINGSMNFKESELLILFGEDKNDIIIRNNITKKYKEEYRFNPEIKPIRKYDNNSFKSEIINQLNKISAISKGISAIAILIDLEELFNEETYSYITNLQNIYNFGDKINHGFWDYVGIVFKVRMDSKDFVRRQIDANPKLKQLDRMVHSRYCWVTDRSSPEECYERIGNLAKEVASSNKWGNYTDTALVGEMRDQIQENFDHKHSHYTVPPPEVEMLELPAAGAMLCESLSAREVFLSIDHQFWNAKYTGISTSFCYFFLKNFNADIAKQFKKQYPGGRIAPEKFVDSCLEAMKII